MKLFLAAVLAAAIPACPKTPQPPPSPTPEPSPTATAAPTPEPTAFPTPTPAATPTPTPEPTPDPCVEIATPPETVFAGQCTFKPISSPSLFMHIVKEAQRAAESGGLSVNGHIPNEAAYIDFIALWIRTKGICAINGRAGGHTEDDEVWLKMPKRQGEAINAESEHFDLVAGAEGGKYAWISYEARCRPAAF